MKMKIFQWLLFNGVILIYSLSVRGQTNEMIRLTYVPEWGNASGNLYGKVIADPKAYKVAGLIFIEEAGGWWTKPSFETPAVQIASDSSFMIDFTSGTLDRYCTRLMALLVPSNYKVPVFDGRSGLPSDFLNHPYAIIARNHGDRKLKWAGINWTVKRTVENVSISPGPNLFNSDENNVIVDEHSLLHLKINKNLTGKWLCSELIADTSLGFGTYTFHLKSRVDNLDLNAIMGIFTWDDIAPYFTRAPEGYFREYDIEFGYWSIPGNNVAQYVIQPWNESKNIFRFPMGSEVNTIHQWTWGKNMIKFLSMREDSTVIAQFEYNGNYYKDPGTENIRINLWLNFGQAPQSNQEVVLSGFHFEPFLAAPKNLSATDGTPQKITVTWDDQPGKFFGVYRGIPDDPSKATLLTKEWITDPFYEDYTGKKGTTYHYWIRSSDNPNGSNSSGYASGFSKDDTGWFIDTPLFVQDWKVQRILLISPNPCDEYVKVIASDNIQDGFLQLFNTAGKLVLEQPFDSEATLSTIRLPAGMYQLKLITRQRNACSARFVVRH